jgi:hypothetical protein
MEGIAVTAIGYIIISTLLNLYRCILGQPRARQTAASCSRGRSHQTLW